MDKSDNDRERKAMKGGNLEIDDSKVALSPKEIERLAEVRQALWKGALKGGAMGIAWGGMIYLAAERLPQVRPLLPKKFGLPLSIACHGCLFAYLGSVYYGKSGISEVGDIIRKGETIPPGSYSALARKREKELFSNIEESYHRRADAIKQSVQDRVNKDN
jgi:hypothetical protein